MPLGPLLIRADASAEMGTGHVMRCLALAQAWQDTGGTAMLACAALPPALRDRLGAEAVETIHLPVAAGSTVDVERTIALAATLGASCVAVDGYQFDAAYQRAIKAAGLRLLWIDDFTHASPYCADLVLNQNLGAAQDEYRERSAETQLLLGSSYALLRREFRLQPKPVRNHQAPPRRLLVMTGGADPANLTPMLLGAVAHSEPALEVRVVVGGGNPNAAAIEKQVASLSRPLTLLRSPSDMPGLMAWADLALTAGGSTCWELAHLGVPMLIVSMADNQIRVGQALEHADAAIYVGDHRSVSTGSITDALDRLRGASELRQRLSSQAAQLVDGEGAARVVSRLAQRP
jgi:UDP-2,4-diacetamido-2,4,6-trideoxy-beta-L-altropyranose hydrolase